MFYPQSYIIKPSRHTHWITSNIDEALFSTVFTPIKLTLKLELSISIFLEKSEKLTFLNGFQDGGSFSLVYFVYTLGSSV